MGKAFLEDFSVGETFETQPYTITADESFAFARAYDPQPFHLDAAAAKRAIFGELTCSGWHTAAVTMRLVVESGVMRETGIIGTGIDELRWLAPVKPGDSLHVRGEIVEKLPLKAPAGSRNSTRAARDDQSGRRYRDVGNREPRRSRTLMSS